MDKVVVMKVVREELCLQAECTARSVMGTVFAVFDICIVCCIELDTGHGGIDRHCTAARRILRPCGRQKFPVPLVSVNHEVVVISAAQDQLGISVFDVPSDGFCSRKVESGPPYWADLTGRNLSLSKGRESRRIQTQRLTQRAAARIPCKVKIGVIGRVNICRAG